MIKQRGIKKEQRNGAGVGRRSEDERIFFSGGRITCFYAEEENLVENKQSKPTNPLDNRTKRWGS